MPSTGHVGITRVPASPRVVPPQLLVIFGASGDLARRKLLPALFNLARQGQLPDSLAIVGYGRTPWDTSAFRDHARRSVEEFSRTRADDDAMARFVRSLHYVPGALSGSDLQSLGDVLASLDAELGTEGRRVFYMATPPSAFPTIVTQLDRVQGSQPARVVIEKPFGTDAATSERLNATVHGHFDESQVYRIDHYLGKEAVQNLMVLRFANPLFERVWNRESIEQVQITVSESAGIEGRASYYEEAGATRDMLQNHLLQVMSFVAMERPRSLDADAIRDAKYDLLRAVKPLKPHDVVKGRYIGGNVGGVAVPGYREERGVDPNSSTDTYVAARLSVEADRWTDVPFYLRTGKRLSRRASEITIFFRESPEDLFRHPSASPSAPNHLHISMQPEEGMSFAFHAKQPGPGFLAQTVGMELSYGDSSPLATTDAYERLLFDALNGDHTLFPREDEVERSWEIVAPILGAEVPVVPYRAGSWGPPEADRLVAPKAWHVRTRASRPIRRRELAA